MPEMPTGRLGGGLRQQLGCLVREQVGEQTLRGGAGPLREAAGCREPSADQDGLQAGEPVVAGGGQRQRPVGQALPAAPAPVQIDGRGREGVGEPFEVPAARQLSGDAAWWSARS